MSEPKAHLHSDKATIRLATPDDVPAIRSLFTASLLEGQVAGSDTGADIDNLHAAYFSDEGRSAFWVSTWDARVVGMIGVQQLAEHGAEIRRLRVDETYQRHGIGTRLMHEALTFCKHHGYLKLRLDVRSERGPAIALFEKFGFQLTRTRELDGRTLFDFYLDLYRDHRPDAPA